MGILEKCDHIVLGRHWSLQHPQYNWPLNNVGVQGTNPPTQLKSHLKWICNPNSPLSQKLTYSYIARIKQTFLGSLTLLISDYRGNILSMLEIHKMPHQLEQRCSVLEPTYSQWQGDTSY